MKTIIFIIFISICFKSFSQKFGNTKYLKFKEYGKFGLCDTKGKVKVSAKYENILDFTDDFIILNNEDKCQIIDINEKPITELNKQILEIEFLKSGSVLLFDSVSISVFGNDMKLKTTIPYYIDVDEFEETPNFLVVYNDRFQYSENNLKLLLYYNKDFQLFKTYTLNESNDFDIDKINDSIQIFNIKYTENNKVFNDILDINGKTIIEKATYEFNEGIDWFYNYGDSLQEIYEWNILDKLVLEHYSGKDSKTIIQKITGISQSDSIKKTVDIVDLYGNKLKTFNDCEKIKEEEFFLKDNIAYFKFYTFDKKTEETNIYLMTRDFSLTNYKIDEDCEENDLLWSVNDNKVTLFGLKENKVIVEFTSKVSDILESEDLILTILSKDIIAYKDELSYIVYNVKSKKQLLSFTPQFNGLLYLEDGEADANADFKQITFSFEYSTLKLKDTIYIDTTFSFIKNKDGNYVQTFNKNIDKLYIADAYGLIDSESFFPLKSFYVIEKQVNNDSLIIIDSLDNVIIKTTAKEVYAVDNYIAISDGKTSDLYDMKLKPLKKNIDGAICATINGNLNEYITLKNNSYYYNVGNKSQLMFSENKLMDMPEDFVNHPDSANYYLPQPINHAQKYGNQIILFQFLEYQGYKLSAYNLKTSELQKCNTLYYNMLTEMYDIDNYTYENRFQLLSKPRNSEPCFNSYINFTLDTLSLWYEDSDIDYMLEGIKFDNPNIYVFSSKINSINQYVGTFDSIYFKFPEGLNMYEDYECILGYNKTLKIIDRSTGKLLPDNYSDYINYFEEFFIATNNRTKKQELFRNDINGLKMIFTGNFNDLELLETYTNKVEEIFKLTRQNGDEISSNYIYKNGKPVFDTLKYEIAEGGTDFFSNGETIFVLKSKTDNSYFVLNLITNQAHKIISNSYNPEFDYADETPVMYIYRDIENKEAGNVDILAVNTGETLENINPNIEINFQLYFVAQKMFYSFENENGEMHIYNAKKELIK